MTLTSDQLLTALGAAIRSADQGGNTSAADIRGFLTQLLTHIQEGQAEATGQLAQKEQTGVAESLVAAERTRLDQLLTGAPAALDTLAEITAQLGQDEQGAAAILATQQQHTRQLAGKEDQGMAASLLAAAQQATALVYRAGAAPVYATPTALGLDDPATPLTTPHDLLQLRGLLPSPLYFTNQDYTLAAHEAVLSAAVLGGTGPSRRVRLAGGRVSGQVLLSPAATGDGHDVQVSQAAYLDTLAFLGSGVATRNRYVFTDCAIGRISQAPAAANQQVFISGSVLGGVPDQPVIDGGTASAGLTLTNCLIVLKGTANVLGNSSLAPVYRNVLVVAADGSTTLLGGPASSFAAAQITDASPAGRAWLQAAGPAAWKSQLGLTKADVGLAQVDNTPDTGKPVSAPVSSYVAATVAAAVAAATRALAPAFVAISPNQYGQHPAFSTQADLNAWLLAGARATSGGSSSAAVVKTSSASGAATAPYATIGSYNPVGLGSNYGGFTGINPGLLLSYSTQSDPAITGISAGSGYTGDIIMLYGRGLTNGLVLYVGGSYNSPSGNSTLLFNANQAGTVASFQVPARPDGYATSQGNVLVNGLTIRIPNTDQLYGASAGISFTWLRS